MNVFKVRGYPQDYWFVETIQDFDEIRVWMWRNDVSYMHMASCVHGYGFKVIGSNAALFTLTWAE